MILSSTIIYLLISTLLVFYHFKDKKEIIFVLLAILGISIRQNIYLSAGDPSEINLYTILFLHTDPITTLTGTFLFLYLKITFEGKYEFERIHLLLILPAIFCLINLIPYYLMDFDDKLKFISNFYNLRATNVFEFPYLLLNLNFQRVLIPINNIIGLSIGIYYLVQRRKSISAKKQILTIDGFIMIIAIYLIAVLLVFIRILLDLRNGFNDLEINFPFRYKNEFQYYLNIFIPIFPVCYFLLPSWLFDGKTKNIFVEILDLVQSLFQSNKLTMYEVRTTKSEDKVKILNYIEDQKPYLRIEFSVHDIAKTLNIPHPRVSHCFNHEFKQPFPVYRNRLRVEFAIELLKNEKHKNMSIEGIAAQAGFKTKSSFYAAFRAEYKMTPSEWILKNL